MAVSMVAWHRWMMGEIHQRGGLEAMLAEAKAFPPEPKQPSRWDLREDGRNVAHQHRPGFVTLEEPPEDVPFDTLAELLTIPFVARWVRNDFYRFSLSDSKHLMAEVDGGTSWWVVATLDRAVDGLPVWKSPL